jgi:hypothetical protein
MPSPNEVFDRKRLEVLCNKLLEAGWIKEFALHDVNGLVKINWTPKGMELARQLNRIGDELILDPQAYCALLTICYGNAPHD